jgi:hypothetical protein
MSAAADICYLPIVQVAAGRSSKQQQQAALVVRQRSTSRGIFPQFFPQEPQLLGTRRESSARQAVLNMDPSNCAAKESLRQVPPAPSLRSSLAAWRCAG